MDIEFIGRNKFAVSKPHHVDEALEDFGETLKVNMVNPETSQLFTITSYIEVGKRSYCVLFTVVYKFMRTNMLVLVYVIVVVTSYLSARLQTRVSSAVWVISPQVLHV